MSLDYLVDTDEITSALESLPEPAHEGYPEMVDLAFTNGRLNPYRTVDYGSPFASFANRSISTEPIQPIDIRVIVSHVADDANLARRLQRNTVQELTGFKPTSNSGPLRLVGGGSYTRRYQQTGPIIYVAESYFAFVSNIELA